MDVNGTADVGSLGVGQRAVRALDLIDEGWDEKNAMARWLASRKSIERVRGILARRPDLRDRLRSGELSVNAAMVEAGYVTNRREVKLGFAAGKGDKWAEIHEMILRYLDGQRSQHKGVFEFRHLNPNEAAKRVRQIDNLTAELAAMRADLEPRTHKARLSVPSH